MDWMNRSGKPTNSAGQPISPVNNADNSQGTRVNVQRGDSGNKNNKRRLSFHTVTSVVMLFSLTLLALAVIGFIMNFRDKNESRYVAKDKMQAVFLNGGQVYFGKIRELNNKYIGITDIYYLRVNQQVQPKQGEQQSQQDISLVKLGCELHGPQDQMFINREQVVFWENLKDDGQVAKAVEAYKQANPDGQKCENNQQQATPTNGGNQQQNQNNQNNQQGQNNQQNQ